MPTILEIITKRIHEIYNKMDSGEWDLKKGMSKLRSLLMYLFMIEEGY